MSVQHFTCAAASVYIRLCRGQLAVKIWVVCGEICRTMYDSKRDIVVHLFYDTG